MVDPAALLSRLEALEMSIAHQDTVIEDLNATVTAQWARIEMLLRRLAVIDDRVQEAEARAGAAQPQQRPPHY